MKKIILPLALLLVFGISPLQAQYHNIGDTVWYYDSIWWAPQWYTDWISPANMPNATSTLAGEYGYNDGEALMMHVVDHPIRVIGIACCIQSGNELLETGFDSMTSAQEYFLIYRDMPEKGVTPLRSVPWNPEDPHRYLESRLTSSPDSCQTYVYSPWPSVKPLYEVYFEDTPLVITDTFYIGCSFHSDTIDLWSSNRACGYALESGVPRCPRFPWMTTVKVPDRDGIYLRAGVPYVETTQRLWCVFPILSQDTDFSLLDSCPAAGSVWLDTTAGGSVLRWDTDSLHALWQVGIGDTGAAHATRFLDTLVRTPTLDLAPLGITPPFSVQVRPQCLCYEYYNVWGDWGDCTDFLPPPEPEPCRPVDGLQFISAGRGMGTLAWTPDSMHTLWQVALGYVGRPVNDAWRDSIVTVPYLDIDSVMAPIAFTAHVRAMCGEDDWSPWATLTADPYATTGLPQPLLKEGSPLFTLTPNPTTGEVTVTLGQPPLTLTHSSVSKADSWLHWRSPTFGSPNLGEQLERMTLTIHDAAGNEVMRKELARPGISISLDLSDLPSGAYFVTLVTPTGSGTQKLVVK